MEVIMKNRFRKYWQNKSLTYRVSLVVILSSLFIAAVADLIANEKPLFCICGGRWHFPAWRDYAEYTGLLRKTNAFDYAGCTHRLSAPVPFSPSTIDPAGSGYLSPAGGRSLSGHKHWLGTDALGRDVLAGMIHGTRYAWLIGLLSTLLAGIPGIFAGMAMGYWRDHKLKLTIFQMIGLFLFFLLWLYEWSVLMIVSTGRMRLFFVVAMMVFLAGVCYLTLKKGNPAGTRTFSVPVDSMLMRFIDYFESFPRLFLMMALLVFLARPSGALLIVLIAFIRWPLFAQVARSETLRESSLNYVLAAENLGLPWYRILTRHIWPNIRSTLLVTALFSVSTAVLLEASLSFIGLGLKLESVTWGSILNEGRQYLPGWWLSVFPGFAMFILLLSLHWILDEKSRSGAHREG